MIAPLLLAAALLSLTPAPVQSVVTLAPTMTGNASTWQWTTHGIRAVRVNLTRGDIQVVQIAGGVLELRARAADPEHDGSVARLIVERTGDRLRIIDRYPPASRVAMRECLPPDGEHGDFWHYPDRVELTLFVPTGTVVSGSAMAGRVYGD